LNITFYKGGWRSYLDTNIHWRLERTSRGGCSHSLKGLQHLPLVVRFKLSDMQRTWITWQNYQLPFSCISTLRMFICTTCYFSQLFQI